jgi:hypothetical protein
MDKENMLLQHSILYFTVIVLLDLTLFFIMCSAAELGAIILKRVSAFYRFYRLRHAAPNGLGVEMAIKVSMAPNWAIIECVYISIYYRAAVASCIKRRRIKALIKRGIKAVSRKIMYNSPAIINQPFVREIKVQMHLAPSFFTGEFDGLVVNKKGTRRLFVCKVRGKNAAPMEIKKNSIYLRALSELRSDDKKWENVFNGRGK